MISHRHRVGMNEPVGRSRAGESGKVSMLVLFLLLLGVVAGAWWYKSRPAMLGADARAYFQKSDDIPRESNGWFVLMGLDVMPDLPAVEAGLSKYDIMRGKKSHSPVPPELHFAGDLAAFSCWYIGHPDAADCPDQHALDALLSDNYDLLIRLESLASVSQVVQPPGTADAVSEDMIENLFHLKMAELVLLLEQDRPEDALEIWINGWRVLRDLSLGRVDLHWRGVFAGLLNQWAGMFPAIMNAEPEQLTRGGARRLFFLVRPNKIEDMGFEARLRHLGHLVVDDAIAQSSLGGAARENLKNRLMNIYYTHVVDIIAELKKNDVSEIYQSLLRLRNEEHEENKAKVYNLPDGGELEEIERFHEAALEGIIKSIQADLANNEYSRMFILDIDAFDHHIPAQKMQEYLDVQQEFMQSQITGKPFSWDPERHDIYFISPDHLERRLSILRFRVEPEDESGTDETQP